MTVAKARQILKEKGDYLTDRDIELLLVFAEAVADVAYEKAMHLKLTNGLSAVERWGVNV